MGHDRTYKKWHLAVMTGQRGSVLVALIITMVIIAGLGSALITMSTTSSLSQFGAMDSFRAYYLAESGGRYALPIIKKNISDPATLLAQLNGKTFTLANNDAFQLTLSYAAPVYTLVSKGILSQGSQALNATRSVTYTITGPGGTNIPFNADSDLTSNWTGYVANKTEVENNDGSSALNVSGKDVSLQLAWDGSATLPNLATAWAANGGLLSYELQVKIKLEDVSEYMTGLSFRDRTNSDPAKSSNSRYGLSFLKKDKCHDIPGAICSAIPKTGKLYVVLWKNINGVYSVLRFHEATGADNILNGTMLKDWSTLVVKLEEQFVIVNGQDVRKNFITAYVQGTSVYQRDTIDWDYTKFITVTWDAGSASPVEDTSLTSENFDTLRPMEIGLHSFYPNAGNTKQFFDDFSLTLGSGGGSASVVQY